MISFIVHLHVHVYELFQMWTLFLDDKVNTESKIATVGTIYGMILNCRNKKASTIQRLYTALAIRYHADNKVQLYKFK